MDIKELERIVKNHEKRLKKLEGSKEKNTKYSQSNSKNSARAYILELKESGFLKTPKTFNQIKQELEKRGHYFNRTSLSKPILSLVKKQVIGRVGKKGNWKYVSRS
ncbi:MAG: hypothetical protein GWN01_11980 [Nitrosopumilaceae archaeon]|nr:hypothetical protein [Nitrosopumilaceae archaeon]NIU01595.1 hypothetical protein [Nitrosopumilaceae archaeon]NIU88014.1 hypothetical protein [Nitrosopumilaceae archaeon]NIV66281.1 hypothetical protein [Nitrosopumilaceae archaeon]NIX62197.1 hypothetical protein [Nitrosopumilaceae archaeon]